MENFSSNTIEIEWLEHMNSLWALKNIDHIASRDFVQFNYETLLQNKEIQILGKPTVSYDDMQVMPNFHYDPTSVSELNYYISTFLNSQFQIGKEVCTCNPFTCSLRQRLIILQRVYYSIVMKYHGKDNQYSQKCEMPSDFPVVSSIVHKETTYGPQALLEIGVKTGLSLLFSLLQQNWQVSGILGIPSLCNSVLETTVDLLQKLPPLSLSNDSQLTNLGTSSLEQVCNFLKDAVLNETSADLHGKVLSSEILLGIYLQRGSLRYLLDWIKMSLEASCQNSQICSKSFKKYISILANQKLNIKSELYPDKDKLTIYEAALYLMQILVSMIVDYGGENTIVDIANEENKITTKEKCDVFVWGSNSCHQLAEGNQEKILLPIKSKIFYQVQQVSTGYKNNIDFIVLYCRY